MTNRWLPILLLCAGCGAAPPPTSDSPTPTADSAAHVAKVPPVAGIQTFVIVPEQSRASYHANEEFFAGAMKLLGIDAGKVSVVGSTQAIEGQFQFDPEQPAATLGANSFSVRVDTLRSNQQKRDDYMRERRDDGGPSFDMYPTAVFNATSIAGRRSSASGDVEFRLTGDLTLRGITKVVVLDVIGRVAGETFTGSATTGFLLSDFAIGPIEFAEILRVADPVQVTVDFTARAQGR
jgi:polyisoprenoid-binding protein YceI